MQKNNIDKIISEIYMLDEELKKYDAEIRKVVAAMIEARPDARIDRDFISRLRKELMDKAGEAAEREPAAAGMFTWKNLAYAFSGAALIFVMMLPFIDFGGRSPLENLIRPGDSPQTEVPGTVSLEKNAFGSLLAADGPLAADGSVAAPQLFASEGRGAAESVVSTPAIGLGGGGGITKMIAPGFAPEMISFEYKYVGGDLPVADPAMPVYRRDVNSISSAAVLNALQNTRVGLLDMAKLSSPGVDSINIIEDREYGYMVYANFRDGSFSVSMNWEKWPHPEAECRDEQCFERYRLKAEDVPSDDEMITIADGFLKAYGIDTAGYGEPRVNDYWRRTAGGPEVQALYYVPETIQVIYPEIIDGRTVYDESGNPGGLTVDVNIRYRQAAGLYNAFMPGFEKSDYAVVTDSAKIIAAAEKGGTRPVYFYGEAGRTVMVELGTPALSLVRHWHYNPEKNRGGELYVPAYIFPILNPPEEIRNYYYAEAVIVPLPREIFDRMQENEWIGIPNPTMPLIEGTAPSAGMDAPAVKSEEVVPDAVKPEDIL